MPKIENASSGTPEAAKHIHRSVRVFAVAPIRVQELAGKLEAGTSLDELSLVEVILAQKNDTRWVTALGGKLLPGEDLLRAGMRTVFSKSLLTRESIEQLRDSVGHGNPIAYTETDTGIKRKAFLVVMPVRPASVSLHEPREDKDPDSVYKINALVSLTPDEFVGLFANGVVSSRDRDHRIFGHLTLAHSSDVKINDQGRLIQQQEFDRVIGEIHGYEESFRSHMKEHINLVRRWHNKPLISNFGECSKEEIIRGFQVATWVTGMHDGILRDAGRNVKLPAATDLLTSGIYLRELDPLVLPDTLLSAPTREIRKARNILNAALRETVVSLYGLMGRDINRFRSQRGIDSIGALRDLWPDVVELPVPDRVEIIKVLDARFIGELALQLHKPFDVVKRALALPYEIPEHIASEMKYIKDTFQEHHPTNEVASAIERPFRQVLHVLGLHPDRNIPVDAQSETLVRTRGEMMLLLGVLFSAIPIVEQYDAADNSLFESGLAGFLEYPPELAEMKLGKASHTIFRRITKDNIGDRRLEILHDRPPIKTIVRWWFKSLQEKHIYDAFRHNFVIRPSNFTEKERRNIPLRLQESKEFSEALINHFKAELGPSGWEVSIVPGTHKTAVIDTVRKLITIRSPEKRKAFVESHMNGKRPGSVGNLIIREKFVLAFTKNGHAEYTEVCNYPFERVDVHGTMLEGSGLIAFTEKILDDVSGKYKGYRLLQTDPEDPTAPAVINYWSPEVWDRNRFLGLKDFQHTPKK